MAILKALPVHRSDDVPQPSGPNLGPEKLLTPDVMRAIARVPLAKKDLWREHAAPTYQPWVITGSMNWPTLAGAIRLWEKPQEILEQRDGPGWWRQWFRWQLGRDGEAPGCLGLFQGTEVHSNNYDGLTIGAVCAVRLWALRNDHAELRELTGAWLTVYAALAVLGAMPWPTSLKSHVPEGVFDIPLPKNVVGPYRLQIGGRSTNQHYTDDAGCLLLAELLAWPGARHPWPDNKPWSYWYLQVADMLQGDVGVPAETQATMRTAVETGDLAALDKVAALLEGVKFGGMEILRWPGQSAGVMPRIINGNTAAVMGSTLRASGQVDHLFPWPKPKPGNLGSGEAWIDLENHTLNAKSGFGSLKVDLPAEPPVRHWIVDGQGLRRV
jgi:hypothetical protein